LCPFKGVLERTFEHHQALGVLVDERVAL
jgi:hypothetical protein